MAAKGTKQPDNSFLEFVLDQLRDLDGVAARRMFASHGLYRGDKFFAVVWKGRLFLKTDDTTRAKFIAAGSEPFRPTARQTLRSYYEVPADVLDDRAKLVRWAEESAKIRS
jgi:DNA transformation protein